MAEPKKPCRDAARPRVVNTDLAAFLRQIAKRGVQGEAARKHLAAHLATLSLEELRQVDPALVSRLGPEGVAHLVKVSAALRAPATGLAPRAPKAAGRASVENVPEAQWRVWLRGDPAPWRLAKSLIALIVFAMLFVEAVPLAFRAAFNPPVAEGLSWCRQLDRFTGDCTYRPAVEGLTMERAAEALHLPMEVLAAANPNLSRGGSLPSGASLRVPARYPLNLR